MREAAGGRRLGQLLDAARCRTASSTAGDERALVEPGGLGEDAQLEPRPGDGCQLEQSRPSREPAATRRCRTTSRSRSGPRSSASGRDSRTPPSETSTRAALAQVAPELAEQQRRAVGQLAERRRRAPPVASASVEARMNAPTSSSLSLPSESRVTPSRRDEVGERVGERAADLLAAVAVGGERRAAAPPAPSAPGGGAAAASRRLPSGRRRRRAAAAAARLSRREQLGRGALEQVAVALGIAARGGGRRSGARARARAAPAARRRSPRHCLERVGIADARAGTRATPAAAGRAC